MSRTLAAIRITHDGPDPTAVVRAAIGMSPAQELGKMGGVERLRIRYRQYATPWYDVLFASRDEVTQLAGESGWIVKYFIDDGKGYVGVLELAPSN